MEKKVKKELLAVEEFQAALVRLGIWLFAAGYVGLSSMSEHYAVNLNYYAALFSTYLIIFIGIFISVLMRRTWPARRYFTLVVDITATSFAIFLTGDAVSPFYILYFWIFISYGTRYGVDYLKAASIISIIALCIVSITLDAWGEKPFELGFLILSLIILPLYQHTLLKKLYNAKQEAEASSKAKSMFLANMSHEIRTPLNGLMTMAQLMLRSGLNDTQEQYARNLLSSGNSLNTILNEILDYSKIESGEIQLRYEVFSVQTMLGELKALMGYSAEEKGLTLDFEIEKDIPQRLCGDPSRLRQVLVNLVGNAIKFTPRGGVTMSVQHVQKDASGDVFRFAIMDTGIGISEQDREKLFQHFSQLDTSLARHHGGTGLGLAISKRLVEAMGGAIGMESHEGAGSTFWFDVPLQQASQDTAQQQSEPTISHALDQLKILLVDDDAINRMAATHLLEHEGHQISVAKDGYEALDAIKSEHFDLVLMDVHMPNLDGIAATRKIRNEMQLSRSQLPILGVTASVMQDEQLHYLEAGMNGVIAKPINMDNLKRKLSEAIVTSRG